MLTQQKHTSAWTWMWFILFLGSFAINYWQHTVIKTILDNSIIIEINKDKNRKLISDYIQEHNKQITSDQAKRLAFYYVEAGEEFRIDPLLLAAVSAPESGFNCSLVSNAGAIGCMQVMPFWVEEIDFLSTPKDLFNPRMNIRAGAYILSKYQKECKEGAIRCYNGGPRAITNPKPETINFEYTVNKRYNQIRYI